MLNSLSINGHYVSFDEHNPIALRQGLTLITGKNGRGKCLRGTTVLRDPNTGESRTIQSLAEQGVNGFQVMGYDTDMKLRPTPVVAAVSSGMKPLFRLHLSNGYQVDCSATHPFLTSLGTLPLQEIQVGARVAIPGHISSQGSTTRKPFPHPELMAALIADGGLTSCTPTGGLVTYTKQDPLAQTKMGEWLEPFRLKLQKMGRAPQQRPGAFRIIDADPVQLSELFELLESSKVDLSRFSDNHLDVLKGKRGVGVDILRKISQETGDPRFSNLADRKEASHVSFRTWLSSWGGVGVGSKEKRIPEGILQGDYATQHRFMQTLFAGDGHVSKIEAGPGLEYSSASHQLILDLKFLLLQLGVASRVSYKLIKRDGKTFHAWRLTPYAKEDAIKLLHLLKDLPNGAKQLRVRQHLELLSQTKKTGFGSASNSMIPLELYRSEIQRLFEVEPKHIPGRNPGYFERFPQSKANLSHLNTLFATPSPLLKTLSESEVYWGTVTKIEDLGVTEETYDIEVGNSTHLYALDGVITHNSTVLELIRYALFGSRALRRPMSDYKGLSVVLDFTLKGVGYKVTRSSALTLLATADGTNLATGTTPVNQAVTNLFGYGLAVFDIANCCGQNQVMLFSDRMQPGDRKKLIDQTVGLSAIDDLAAELNAEALAIGKEITFLDQRLGEAPPQEPSRPNPFRDLENLRADCSKAQGAWAQAQVIRSTLSRLDLTPPVAPTPVDLPAGFNPEAVQQEIAGLRVRQTRRSFLLGTVNQRPVPPAAPVNPDITFSDEELTAKISDAQTHKILNQQLAALDLPTLSLEQIDEAAANLSLWNDFQAAKKLREQGDAECPACGHHFPNAHKALEHYAHVPAEMERPSLTSDYLVRQRLLHENIQKGETLKAALISLEPLMPEAEQLRTHLRSYQTQLEAYNTQATQYQAALEAFQTAESELSEIPDGSGLITSLEKGLEAHRSHTAAIEKFEQAKIKHAEAVAEHARLTEELVAVDSEAQKLTGLQQLLEEHLTYQEAYKAYTKRLGDWNADSDKLRELTAQRDDLKAGKSALTDLKVRIKSYLLPSLNSVSSQLLFEMTGGELSEVKLDEDFEILVDSKPIAAMSGSEQAVANLAIRLGLGQILTNRVFSVFMGDELDASMDDDRAAYLMECLRRLRGSISQILLVTHKQFEADNTISLMRRK